MRAQIEKMTAPSPLDEPFIGGYTVRQFQSLTPDIKEYALAKEQAKRLGDTEFMTLKEWKNLDKTERMKFIEELITHPDPEVRKLAKEIYGPTRISIGEKAETAGAIAKVTAETKRKAEVLDPGYWRSIEKGLRDSMGKAAWSNLPKAKEYMKRNPQLSASEARRKAQQIAVLEEWDREIRKYVPEAKFEYDKEPPGWYVEDELIVESPYK